MLVPLNSVTDMELVALQEPNVTIASVKSTSVNPLPIVTVTYPPWRFGGPPRSGGSTVMFDTKTPGGMVSVTVTGSLTGHVPSMTQLPPGSGPAFTISLCWFVPSDAVKVKGVPTKLGVPAILQIFN